jgi:hypothetical protein
MPGSPSGLQSRLSTPSVAFALTTRARLFLVPANAGWVTARQASLDATDRSLAPPKGAFDAGLRRRAFPPDAASLLPGLLAATRTGLPPAGNDELMLDQVTSINHLQLWAHVGFPWKRVSFVEMVVGVVACRPSGIADLSSRARRGPGLLLVRCVSTRRRTDAHEARRLSIRGLLEARPAAACPVRQRRGGARAGPLVALTWTPSGAPVVRLATGTRRGQRAR